MVMEETPSPHLVGIEFVRQYYTMLNHAPLHLHRFYNDNSSFVHGGMDTVNREAKPVYGQHDIHQKIMQLNFRDCHAKILQVDSHATLGDGVVIQVSGELSNNGQPMRRFMQTFVLALQSPKKYYVHNDIFRYQDVIFDDEEDEEGVGADQGGVRSEGEDPEDEIPATSAPPATMGAAPQTVGATPDAVPAPAPAPEPTYYDSAAQQAPAPTMNGSAHPDDSHHLVSAPAPPGTSQGQRGGQIGAVAVVAPMPPTAPAPAPAPAPTPIVGTVAPMQPRVPPQQVTQVSSSSSSSSSSSLTSSQGQAIAPTMTQLVPGGVAASAACQAQDDQKGGDAVSSNARPHTPEPIEEVQQEPVSNEPKTYANLVKTGGVFNSGFSGGISAPASSATSASMAGKMAVSPVSGTNSESGMHTLGQTMSRMELKDVPVGGNTGSSPGAGGMGGGGSVGGSSTGGGGGSVGGSGSGGGFGMGMQGPRMPRTRGGPGGGGPMRGGLRSDRGPGRGNPDDGGDNWMSLGDSRPQNNYGSSSGGDGDRRRSVNSGHLYADSQQLFVGNLPHHVGQDDLKELFGRFGTVLEVRISSKAGMKTVSGGRVPNYSFVVFDDETTVQAVLNNKPFYLKSLQGQDHKLNVEEKKTRMRNEGGGGGGMRMGGGDPNRPPMGRVGGGMGRGGGMGGGGMRGGRGGGMGGGYAGRGGGGGGSGDGRGGMRGGGGGFNNRQSR